MLSRAMLLLFDRCRGSVEISAQQFPKLAYVHAHCGTLRSRFTKRHFTLLQSLMQLFVFVRIIVLIIRIRTNSKEPLFGTALLITIVVGPVLTFNNRLVPSRSTVDQMWFRIITKICSNSVLTSASWDPIVLYIWYYYYYYWNLIWL